MRIEIHFANRTTQRVIYSRGRDAEEGRRRSGVDVELSVGHAKGPSRGDDRSLYFSRGLSQ